MLVSARFRRLMHMLNRSQQKGLEKRETDL